MSNNTLLNIGISGDMIADLDLTNYTSYPISGKLELTGLYVGSGAAVAPTPVSYANPIPVVLASGNVPIGKTQITSGGIIPVSVLSGQAMGSFQSGAGPASGQPWSLQVDGSGNLQVSVNNKTITSGSVIVSGNVGVSGSVQLLSGSAWIGEVLGTFASGTGPASGQPWPLQVDGSGRLVVAATVNVGASPQQILSGSAYIGVVEGAFLSGTGPTSGQPWPLQVDGSGRLLVAVSAGAITSGSVQVSGIVGISGSIGILSGQVSVSSGLVGVLSGNIGAQVSGAVQVSGNVGVSGAVLILSGSNWVGTVLGTLASGTGPASGQPWPLQVDGSGRLQVAATVNVTTSPQQILSGSAYIGVVEGAFLSGTGPTSGQPWPLQIDGSGNLQTIRVNLTITSGSVQVSGIVGISGSVGILSGSVSISSGNVGATVSGGVNVSGSVIVSGNVGVSGSVQLLSGSAWIGEVLGTLASGKGPASGQPWPLQVDGSGNLQTARANLTITSGSVQVSGAVQVSGNVGVSGSVQLLSGSAWIGEVLGTLASGTGPASGQPWPLQVDGSGRLQVAAAVNTAIVSGSVQVSGAVAVSGIVGISGSVGILSGQVSLSSGNVGATVSGGVNVSGSVIVSGNVGVSGSVQLLSGSAILGNVNIQPGISGGLGLFRAFSGLTNTGSAIQVQSGTTQVMDIRFINNSFSGMYLKIYDQTSGPTIGTTVPIMTFRMGINEQGPDLIGLGGAGLQVNQGLWVNTTLNITDADTTNCSGCSGLVYAWFLFKSGY